MSVFRLHSNAGLDVIGDVHGCIDELIELLALLGHALPDGVSRPPSERVVVFVGDLCDRGPDTPAVFRLVQAMCDEQRAVCVRGNHDHKLMRWLQGRKVSIAQGLELSIKQMEPMEEHERQGVMEFIDSMPTHCIVNDNVVIAHAGIEDWMIDRDDTAVRAFTMFGTTDGEVDEFGLPNRREWIHRHETEHRIVYGHTPVLSAEWFNNTIDIDTGCVFGGSLTALRYPEMDLVSVPARMTYATRRRPFMDF
jgi:diadenosine tetraphosphatase ApaH/serine/threonine PP2A family protein phosphatase